MKIFLAIILILVFFAIATIHFYWAFGGKKWANLALPTTNNQIQVFKPRMFETLAVAIIFLGFAFVVASDAITPIGLSHSDGIANKITWGIAIIFIARAIGEFKYVGFFKKIKHTDFGRMDSKYYSPFSLVVGLILLTIKFL